MALGLLVRLSVRNLFRHRRRTAMLLAAICVAVSGVLVLNSLIRGFQFDMADAAISNLTGHVKVLAPGYRDDPSIQKSFELAEDFEPDVPPDQLVGWAARVRVPAVIMSERETRGVQLVGVDPAQEHISFLGSAGIEGDPLAGPADKRVLIGAALAEQLDTGVGRRLVMISQGVDGTNREAGFRIAGTYDTDGTGIEKMFVFTGVETAQRLLETSAVTEVSIRLQSEAQSFGDMLKRSMVSLFVDLEVLDWQELEPQAAAMFVFADTAILIWFLIMMGALIFGLMNTLITSVMERVKELGMLRAIGMRPGAVVVQVVLESMIVMTAGIAIGVVLGYLYVGWLGDGIDLTAFAEGMELAGARSLLVPHLLTPDVVQIVVLSLVFGGLASLYPAWRATRIKPLEALRR